MRIHRVYHGQGALSTSQLLPAKFRQSNKSSAPPWKSHGGALDFCQQMRTLKGPHHIAQGLLVVIDQRQNKPFIPALRHPAIVPVFPVDRIFLRDAFIHAVFHDLHLCACELLQAVIAAIGKTGQPSRRLRIVSDDAVLLPASVKLVDMPESDQFPILRSLRLTPVAQPHRAPPHRTPPFHRALPPAKPKRKADKAGASDCADQHQDQSDERRRPGSFSHTFHLSSFHPLIAVCPAAALSVPPPSKKVKKKPCLTRDNHLDTKQISRGGINFRIRSPQSKHVAPQITAQTKPRFCAALRDLRGSASKSR